MPTIDQLEALYRVSHQLTFEMSQPIYLVWLDKHTQNLYLIAGYNYEIEFELSPSGGLKLMNQPDYAVMTHEQIKYYIVKYREDKAALSAYLERRHQQNHPIIANVKDVDFDHKLRTAIAQKLSSSTVN